MRSLIVETKLANDFSEHIGQTFLYEEKAHER